MKIVLLVLLFTTNAFANDSGGDLQRVISAFYGVYLELKPVGVPDEKKRTRFTPHISEHLNELLKGANEAERSYYKATKGRVPPLVEGDLFTSNFEGADSFRGVSYESKGERGFCLVEFTYIDPLDKSSLRWKDKVYLVKSSRGWVVDDIEFLGNWPFMHKGRLQDLLKWVIKEGRINSLQGD